MLSVNEVFNQSYYLETILSILAKQQVPYFLAPQSAIAFTVAPDWMNSWSKQAIACSLVLVTIFSMLLLERATIVSLVERAMMNSWPKQAIACSLVLGMTFLMLLLVTVITVSTIETVTTPFSWVVGIALLVARVMILFDCWQ